MMSSKDPGTLGYYGFPEPGGPLLREDDHGHGRSPSTSPALGLPPVPRANEVILSPASPRLTPLGRSTG